MSEKLASLKNFCKCTGRRRGRSKKHVLMQEPGVAEFLKPAIVKNKTQSIMPSSQLHFEAWKFKKITDLSKCDRVFHELYMLRDPLNDWISFLLPTHSIRRISAICHDRDDDAPPQFLGRIHRRISGSERSLFKWEGNGSRLP
jgi:hypothetical protein